VSPRIPALGDSGRLAPIPPCTRVWLFRALRFHPANGVADQGRDVLQFQFLFDVTPVDVDGLRAEAKLFRNVTRAFALADQLENLELTVGEFSDRRARTTRL